MASDACNLHKTVKIAVFKLKYNLKLLIKLTRFDGYKYLNNCFKWKPMQDETIFEGHRETNPDVTSSYDTKGL